MKKQVILNIIIILVLILSICTITLGCEKSSEPAIIYTDVSGVSVDSNASELNLQGKNITDISALYSLNNLETVDLRDNPINQDDILDFIASNPNCKVIWSIPVYDNMYDSTSTALDLNASDTVSVNDFITFIDLFKSLETIRLQDTNISASDYKQLSQDYPQIVFDMIIQIGDSEFKADSAVVDLAEAKEIAVDSLLDKLKYFNDITAINFGDSTVSNELKDSLLEQYPNVDFNWNTQLLDSEYSSAESEIDISGIEVTDLEEFKNQLKYLTNLEYIDMCDCSLSNLEMEELIAEYPSVKFVWKIKVGSWEMRTDIKAFGTCYDGEFEGGRYVGGEGECIETWEAANLKYCKDLVTLDIGHQIYITDFSFLLELHNLKHLIVALSHFEDTSLLAHMKELEFLEIFNTDVYDLSPLVELPNLKYLNCSQTLIPNVDYLVDMKQLEVLWLCNAKYISREEAARLEEALPNCYINTTAQGSTREGWRSYDNQGYIDMRESLNMYLAFDTGEK